LQNIKQEYNRSITCVELSYAVYHLYPACTIWWPGNALTVLL